MTKTTHFGFNVVPETEKARKVAGVFDSVAERYDLMNDLMSAGCIDCGSALPWKQAASGRVAGCSTLQAALLT